MNNNQNIIIYQSGEVELNVSIDNETIWLRQDEISKLFKKDRTVITRHINNILKDKEVDEKSNVQKMHIPNSDKPVKLYSLDIILAIGYRTNSAKAIKFRQWATNVLKKYIFNGYAINGERITNQRFIDLENEVIFLKNKVNAISKILEDKSIKPKQGVFYDGQVFDAYIFVADLIKSAKKSILLIDNYIDESILQLFTKRKKGVTATIYTKNLPKVLKQDLEKFNTQYPKMTIKKFNKAHDRFLIIDETAVYHFGASLKDLGKKWFAFSKMDLQAMEMIAKIKNGNSIKTSGLIANEITN
ncbi:virulence RhuM family protein [bacterium]|nr:virulence RhuM family protein [bacterium]